MKPWVNLTDPKVEQACAFLEAQKRAALAVEQRVESATFPIYFPLKSWTKPEQIGSGVVVKIGDQYFVFSASHVFDDIGQFPLLLGLGDGKLLLSLEGERFSTLKGPSGTHKDDPLDASVFHIQSELPRDLASVALSFDDLDSPQPDTNQSVFLVAGFRIKESKTLGRQASAHRACYPTLEYSSEVYSSLAINPETHIAAAFENQILVDNIWETSPLLRGVSGGAVIRIQGTSLNPHASETNEKSQILTAIVIEHRREKARKPGVVVGTRIGIHLSLINKFLPSLKLE